MAGCSICKYENRGKHEFPCNECIHNATDKFAPQTNADRIRNMTDEELAEYLSELIRNASDYITGEGNWLQWLKSEVKE